MSLSSAWPSPSSLTGRKKAESLEATESGMQEQDRKVTVEFMGYGKGWPWTP
jgi:hypothetical protein